jgi:hypothetical protein
MTIQFEKLKARLLGQSEGQSGARRARSRVRDCRRVASSSPASRSLASRTGNPDADQPVHDRLT